MSFVSERRCPLCESPRTHSTPEVRASVPAEGLSFDELREFFVGFRKGQCFFTYHRCQCGLLWCPDYFSEEALSELYASMPENTAVSGERDSARTQLGYADLITRRLAPANVILELGADIGLLLGELSSRRSRAHVHAVEPNRAVHRDLVSALPPEASIYEDINEISNQVGVDLALAVHVLDHVLAPRAFIESIHRKGSEGMFLFLVVHDESSVLRKLLGARWAPFCLQHPQLFNPRTVTDLLMKSGVRVTCVEKTKNWLSPRQAGGLLASIGLAPSNLVRALPDFSLPIALGNIAVFGQALPVER